MNKMWNLCKMVSGKCYTDAKTKQLLDLIQITHKTLRVKERKYIIIDKSFDCQFAKYSQT